MAPLLAGAPGLAVVDADAEEITEPIGGEDILDDMGGDMRDADADADVDRSGGGDKAGDERALELAAGSAGERRPPEEGGYAVRGDWMGTGTRDSAGAGRSLRADRYSVGLELLGPPVPVPVPGGRAVTGGLAKGDGLLGNDAGAGAGAGSGTGGGAAGNTGDPICARSGAFGVSSNTVSLSGCRNAARVGVCGRFGLTDGSGDVSFTGVGPAEEDARERELSRSSFHAQSLTMSSMSRPGASRRLSLIRSTPLHAWAMARGPLSGSRIVSIHSPIALPIVTMTSCTSAICLSASRSVLVEALLSADAMGKGGGRGGRDAVEEGIVEKGELPRLGGVGEKLGRNE